MGCKFPLAERGPAGGMVRFHYLREDLPKGLSRSRRRGCWGPLPERGFGSGVVRVH